MEYPGYAHAGIMESPAADARTSLPRRHEELRPRSKSTLEGGPEMAATATAEAEVEKEMYAWGVSVRERQPSLIGLGPPPLDHGGVERPLDEDAPYFDDTGGRPGLGEGGELLSRASKTGSAANEYNWGSSSPEECLSPALRGVHRVAVETRRSFEAIDRGMLELESARKSDARGGDEDDDGMEEEEQSLSSKAAYLHQSLTDVSVEDIDVRDVLGVVSGSTNSVESHGRGNLAGALAAAAAAGEGRDRGGAGDVRARSGKRRGGVSGDRRGWGSGRGRAASSSEDGAGLVLRTMARRPLKEMMRLEEAMEEESGEAVVRLEHLPPFTERWTPEALTPHILSQVFSGLAPMASRQEHGEPVCTYMLECCVRPDIEAVTILHVVSATAAENGLELVRKRGGQVLYGIAPQTTESRHFHPHQHQPSQRVGTRSVSREDKSTAPPSPGTAAALSPPRSAEPDAEERGGAQEEEEAEYEARGVAGIRLSSAASAASSDGGFEGSAEKDRPGRPLAASAEFVGWGGSGGAGWGPWSHVDMQLVVGQASKHRVLLIRFVTARTATCRDVVRVATAAADIGQPLAIAPAAQNFASGVRAALRERGVLMESLEDFPPQEERVMLDPHFLAQVEGMCQWDMVASLREAGVSLDEHARNEELRGVVVTRMLEEMFDLVGLPMLPPPPQLVLAVPRPNDILPASVEPMMDLSEEDEDELTGHVFVDEASRVMATVLARCIRYTERCDEQMTARMQRKNRQVMQRISRSQLYQRELFQALRDGHMAVRRARLTTYFNNVFGTRPEADIDPNVETPVYFCTIVSTRRPGVLYLTYWHLCVITRVPGFSPNVLVMPLEDIDAVEMIKLFVGYGIRVRKRTTPGPSPIMSTAPSSDASSTSSPPQPCRSNGQADETAAAKKTRPSTITFATTKVSTAELRELIVALVRVHREPVTSPSRAETKAAAAAAARASSSL